MRNVLARICLTACLFVAACACASAQSREVRTRTVDAAQADAEAPLTNMSVIKLARAKFSDKMIVAIVQTRPAKFDLSPDRLIELKKNGVSERVILAMLARGDASQLAAAQMGNDPDDDAFFNDLGGARPKSNAGAQGTRSSPNETDIFGSSGGASGQSRTNGVNSGASGDTLTTGSATVHIIRPQEQNGAPKLERTPTLNNDSIVELVEAGFSEGTIIRRIENSPAEFDLSAAKLAELRKRRVTEPVISAMRAAMSDDTPASKAPAHPDQR
jgi:hypothetical protein